MTMKSGKSVHSSLNRENTFFLSVTTFLSFCRVLFHLFKDLSLSEINAAVTFCILPEYNIYADFKTQAAGYS